MKNKYYLSLAILVATVFISMGCEQECKHPNLTENIISPTCTQSGHTEYKCTDCDYSYVECISEPTGHTFEKTTVDATCIKDGYTIYKCDCGFSYSSDYVSAKGHTYNDKVTDPTCTDEGYTTYTCSVCSHSYFSDKIPPVYHVYEKTSVAPTCTSEGYTLNKCQSCSLTYKSEHIAPTAHKFEKKVVAPTCTTQGYTVYTCEDCKYSFESEHVAPLGHIYDKTVIAPTCTSEGYTEYTCQNCDHDYTSDYTKPVGHIYEKEKISDADCTMNGEERYLCKCGDTYTVITPPNGHDFSKTVIMPTLSDMGYTEYMCNNTDCGYTYTGDNRFYKDILPNGAYADNSDVIAKGIDISEHNYDGIETLDFSSIKNAGIDYVIIKAGSTYRENFTLGGKDARFEQSYSDAKAAGLDVGVYFYTYAKSVNEIIQDARLLISILDGKQFEYPIYLDLEDDSLASIDSFTLTEMCVEFFTILQRAGYYTGLYVNDTWLKNHIQTDMALSKFEVWYSRPAETWDVELYGEHLGMWQYSFEGSFDSMPDIPFDLNYSYKDYPSVIINGGFNGFSAEEIRFVDSEKQFVYITANSLNVRSTPDFDSGTNIIGNAYLGECYEVIEIAEEYTKIRYNEKMAYITSNPEYISFEYPF